MDDTYGSLSAAVSAVIESMPDGQYFFGNELHESVNKIYPEAKDVYISSVLQAMRRKCKNLVRCVDRDDSLYQKIGYQKTA